jgi:hypothetical protein
MNNTLIPTAIVDKNGVASTRNKKIVGESAGAASLKGLRPALGMAQTREVVHAIKGKALKTDSPLLDFLPKQEPKKDEWDEPEAVKHPALGKTVNVPDDVLYDFLRLGIDANDAAGFTALGLSPEDVGGDSRFTDSRRSNLNNIRKSYTVYTVHKGEATDRLQEAGVSGVVAAKVLSNGLQDGHLNRALNDEQLVELFSKWKFRGIHDQYTRGSVKSDDIIESMLDGRLPFECRDGKIADLEKIDFEMGYHKDNPVYDEIRGDPDYFSRLVTKASTDMHDASKPLRELHGLVQAFGAEVLDLQWPELANIDVYEERTDPTVKPPSHKAGIEGARFIERARELAEERGGGWGYSGSGSSITGSSGVVIVDRKYLRNWELLQLRDAGLSADEAYEGLIEKDLTTDQLKVMKQTGINSNLADGIL